MVADLKSLPGIVLDGDEPVFAEPWEAQAFAMTLHLYQQGLFTWEEWAQHLSAQIHGGEERHHQCLFSPPRYFPARPANGRNRPALHRHGFALESIVAEKTGIDGAAMVARQKAWEKAAERTPHGKPIELAKSVRSGSKTF